MASVSLDIHYFQYLIWFITVVMVHSFIKKILKPARTTIPEPPSPPALPFIGHLHLVTSVLPKSFQDLARRYGPLMGIRLGASACLVVSNADVAKEIFRTQELNFCSRPEFGSSEYFIYRGSRFVLAQYGDYWRFMKKLCMTRLLAVPQLDKFADIRDQEKLNLVESVMNCCKQGKSCDLSSEFTTLTNNTICRMAMSTRCSGNDNDADEIKELIHTCLKLSGKISVGDVMGPLKVLDFSGNGKKLKAALLKYDKLVERIIKEHQEKVSEGFDVNQKMDLLDILLEVYRDPTAEIKISMKDIKSFLLDIFMAGTDTSSSAMQWAMGELINKPKALKKLREEIDSVVRPDRVVKESDIPNLPYLRAVIRETLRLHPSAPLIIRECGEDCNVNGFLVKSKTRVIVNVYAVMRDPHSWANPNEFDPERFLGSSDEKIGEHQMEFKGQNFRFLPFGSGRRGCPGASLAMLVMHAAVGSLVQCFEWEVKGGERVDLSPGPGFATEMARPLVCHPRPRFNQF
ncbi:putative Cytochrome P450 [Hibiscus syriacus]|uniref:Cytochrome P450 n=1 Tax=Hibiscus syriacus TaxID=106335 RepID=A0A6A3CP72_HIBSY|nr:3,9-dihydroxypterocarpan 6A-monooxygenase [Hibiscus syriacus]KAE8731180.1 putative Cytochrome P450 [Hibiscus syriacus]